MPVNPTYPGVYIEEIPSGVRTITGVATSITAFVGRARRGPVNEPVRVQSFAEYTRLFGGLWQASTMSYAVSQFFQHGGRDALIVRLFNGDVAASTPTITLSTTTGNLVLEAASPGLWGSALRARVNHDTRDTSDALLFNLVIEELDHAGGANVVASESFRNVSVSPLSERFVDTVLNEQSTLVRVRSSAPATESPNDGTADAVGTLNDDGNDIDDNDITGDRNARTGISRWKRPICSTCCASRRARPPTICWTPPGRRRRATARSAGRCSSSMHRRTGRPIPPPPSARPWPASTACAPRWATTMRRTPPPISRACECPIR